MNKNVKLDKKFYGEIRKAKDGSLVPDDEYVVFLAKDNAFAEVLPLYRLACLRTHADAEQIRMVEQLIIRVNSWRVANPDRCKAPDASGEKVLD